MTTNPAKSRRPSAAALAMLRNLHRGLSPTHGLVGRSAHGGATRTLASLYRHDWIDDDGITPRGLAEIGASVPSASQHWSNP